MSKNKTGTLKSPPMKKVDFDYLRLSPNSGRLFPLKAYYKTSRLGPDVSRVAFSVSKKVGNAVVRNRTKRILKETLRKDLKLRQGTDFLFVVHPDLYDGSRTRDVSEKLLLESFATLLERIYVGQ